MIGFTLSPAINCTPIPNIYTTEQLLTIHGMTYVQQSKVYNKTFGQFAMDLLSRVLAAGKKLVISMLFLTIITMYHSKM